MKSSITRNVVTRPIQSGRIAGEVMLNLLFLKLCENIAQLQKVALKRPSKRTALCLRVQKKLMLQHSIFITLPCLLTFGISVIVRQNLIWSLQISFELILLGSIASWGLIFYCYLLTYKKRIKVNNLIATKCYAIRGLYFSVLLVFKLLCVTAAKRIQIGTLLFISDTSSSHISRHLIRWRLCDACSIGRVE